MGIFNSSCIDLDEVPSQSSLVRESFKPFRGNSQQVESRLSKRGLLEDDFHAIDLYSIPKEDAKEIEDIFCNLVTSLITNLRSKMLSSELNRFIFDFIEVSEYIANKEPKYVKIINKIKRCFESHGWIEKTPDTKGGFRTQPDIASLTFNLDQILVKYFK